jgi:hypothetical protein
MLNRSDRYRGQRGQVLPLWIAGSIAALALAFLTLNYANSVRYQIRAQNAADSAASAVVAIQSDQWNEMTALLYADDVEEFRFRRILDAMLLAVHRSGGCNPSGYMTPIPNSSGVPTTAYSPQPQSWYSTAEGTCNRTYIDMRDNLIRSNNRYQQNEYYLNDIALQASFSQFQSNAAAMLSSLQTNCNNDSSQISNPIGGDCGNGNGSNSIKYSFAPSSTSSGYGGMSGNAIAYRTGLGPVELDAADYYIPGLGVTAAKHGLDTENQSLFAPVAVDVVACEKITPLIPSFGPFKQTTYYAIGRAAATNAMVNQEWLEPEVTTLAATQTVALQPAEFYTQSTPDTASGLKSYGHGQQPYDWYSVDFGGNNYTANGTNFTATLQYNELSAYFGWWAPIPILPFGGAVSTASSC